jgi:hypothetical protein
MNRNFNYKRYEQNEDGENVEKAKRLFLNDAQ